MKMTMQGGLLLLLCKKGDTMWGEESFIQIFFNKVLEEGV